MHRAKDLLSNDQLGSEEEHHNCYLTKEDLPKQ